MKADNENTSDEYGLKRVTAVCFADFFIFFYIILFYSCPSLRLVVGSFDLFIHLLIDSFLLLLLSLFVIISCTFLYLLFFLFILYLDLDFYIFFFPEYVVLLILSQLCVWSRARV